MSRLHRLSWRTELTSLSISKLLLLTGRTARLSIEALIIEGAFH